MKNISVRSCRENQNTFFFQNPSSENRAVYENVEKYGRARQASDDTIIRRMRFACWINKATNTHLEYVILIVLHGNNGYAKAPECYIYMYNASLVLFYMKLNVVRPSAIYSSHFRPFCSTFTTPCPVPTIHISSLQYATASGIIRYV
jgi:hypothetical protein